ncbi:hypothetical protein H4582DRAFT_2054579 [Lactarius indigo]|nr:hypothetical protein H4582DRAFT_2054579 [Lactarius indigo]
MYGHNDVRPIRGIIESRAVQAAQPLASEMKWSNRLTRPPWTTRRKEREKRSQPAKLNTSELKCEGLPPYHNIVLRHERVNENLRAREKITRKKREEQYEMWRKRATILYFSSWSNSGTCLSEGVCEDPIVGDKMYLPPRLKSLQLFTRAAAEPRPSLVIHHPERTLVLRAVLCASHLFHREPANHAPLNRILVMLHEFFVHRVRDEWLCLARESEIKLIPHEATADAVRVCLELDVSRYKRDGPLGLFRELPLRTGMQQDERLRDYEVCGGYQAQIALVQLSPGRTRGRGRRGRPIRRIRCRTITDTNRAACPPNGSARPTACHEIRPVSTSPHRGCTSRAGIGVAHDAPPSRARRGRRCCGDGSRSGEDRPYEAQALSGAFGGGGYEVVIVASVSGELIHERLNVWYSGRDGSDGGSHGRLRCDVVARVGLKIMTDIFPCWSSIRLSIRNQEQPDVGSSRAMALLTMITDSERVLGDRMSTKNRAFDRHELSIRSYPTATEAERSRTLSPSRPLSYAPIPPVDLTYPPDTDQIYIEATSIPLFGTSIIPSHATKRQEWWDVEEPLAKTRVFQTHGAKAGLQIYCLFTFILLSRASLQQPIVDVAWYMTQRMTQNNVHTSVKPVLETSAILGYPTAEVLEPTDKDSVSRYFYLKPITPRYLRMVV